MKHMSSNGRYLDLLWPKYRSQWPTYKFIIIIIILFIWNALKGIFHLAMTKSEYVVRKNRLHVLGVSSSTQPCQVQADLYGWPFVSNLDDFRRNKINSVVTELILSRQNWSANAN